MVAVPGFPRPLYPLDASTQGKNPSEDGPDILGIKRTVWRAGRWPGPASGFDDTFSNPFSHGKAGGGVADSGIAGIQRQGKIEPASGWVGEKTFNLLRSIRIPEGLPHAGEPAMDANAANLIAEGYYIHHPVVPPSTTRERALAAAVEWLGYKESPSGSNNSTFGQWYGMNYQPWCAMACTYWYVVDAGGSDSFARGARYSYVPYVVNDARAGRYGLSVPSTPMPGDLVCFDWSRDGTYDHIGLFEGWSGSSPSTFTAIEGNTSTSNNSNGGEVMRRTRSTQEQGTVFVRVAE